MERILRHSTIDRAYWAFAALAVAAAAGLVSAGRAGDFDRFLGPVPPLVVMVVATVVGAITLRFLEVRGWSKVLSKDAQRRGSRRALGEPAAAAIGFAVLAVAADVAIGFSEDMNTPWPRSILFYPAIALVAEVVFHLVPLALVIGAARWRFTDGDQDWRVWTAVAVVAFIETVFQVVDALGGPEPIIAVFVGPHLFAIGAYELIALRRFGFVSVAVFRLTYYVLWHISWGELRLSLLF